MAFLDNDGVKALWEKVKKYVDNHAGGSASQWVGTSSGGSIYIGSCLGSGKELCSITLPEAGTYLVRGFVTFGGAGTANSLLYQVYIDETAPGCTYPYVEANVLEMPAGNYKQMGCGALVVSSGKNAVIKLRAGMNGGNASADGKIMAVKLK